MAFFHRVNAMSRQAELMNWLDIGRVSNADGGKDILLARNERGARIDWRTGEVWLMNPKVEEPFADFLAVERWLTLRDMPTVDKPAPAAPAEPEPAPEPGPARDTLPAFQQKVDDCLAKAEGGQELLETKQAFEAGSEPYLEASTELSKTALELDISPAMVATFHISAFAALAETAGADKLERVAASLHAAARQIRASVTA
ncbi:hypothetical protein ACQ4WP_19375 [Janthinobacterium sp. GB4P2]|uniref:hypothetical protein n=1 Tax=Janthinobacterium sp. GB4P2 TaxID=3424189 RepID=UPI003F206E42